jgi:acyl carrier protein
MTANEHDIGQRVLELVQAALLNDSLNPSDNIFEKGGDSLTFMEICAELEDEFDIEIPLESVWAASSIAEFSAVVQECLNSKAGQPLRSGG